MKIWNFICALVLVLFASPLESIVLVSGVAEQKAGMAAEVGQVWRTAGEDQALITDMYQDTGCDARNQQS